MQFFKCFALWRNLCYTVKSIMAARVMRHNHCCPSLQQNHRHPKQDKLGETRPWLVSRPVSWAWLLSLLLLLGSPRFPSGKVS